MRELCMILAASFTLSLAGCGYNTFQVNDEQVKSSWSEVLNQYQRRADLIPNLVNTVKGYATGEGSADARHGCALSGWFDPGHSGVD